jgi:hypothetical protein
VQQSPPVPKFNKTATPVNTLAMGSILNKLLDKDPNKRFQNASELKAALLDLNAVDTKASHLTFKPFLVRFAVATTVIACVIGICICFCIYNYKISTAIPNARNENSTHSASSDEQAKEAAENSYLESLDEKTRAAKGAAERARRHYLDAVKFQQQKQIDKAEDEIQKAVDETKLLDKHDLMARQILISYAAIMFPQRLIHPGMELIPNFVRVEELLNDTPAVEAQHQSNLYGWHAVTEFEAHNDKKALSLFEKAEALANQEPKNAGHDQKMEWQLWQGTILAKERNIKAAGDMYDRVEREIGNSDRAALWWLFTVKADMLEKSNNKQEAIKFAKKARKIAISSKLDRSSDKVVALNELLLKLGMVQL